MENNINNPQQKKIFFPPDKKEMDPTAIDGFLYQFNFIVGNSGFHPLSQGRNLSKLVDDFLAKDTGNSREEKIRFLTKVFEQKIQQYKDEKKDLSAKELEIFRVHIVK